MRGNTCGNRYPHLPAAGNHVDVRIFTLSAEDRMPPCFYNVEPNSTCLQTQEPRGKSEIGSSRRAGRDAGRRQNPPGGRAASSQAGELHFRLVLGRRLSAHPPASWGSRGGLSGVSVPHAPQGCSLETSSHCENGGQSSIPRAGA